jgi:hypothetical protein
MFLEDFYTWDYFPQLLKYQDLQCISVKFKGFLPEFSRHMTMFRGIYDSIFQAEQWWWRQNTLLKHQCLSTHITIHGITYNAEDYTLRSNPLSYCLLLNLNTFAAKVDHSRFNNSCLRLPASTLVDIIIFQSRSFSLGGKLVEQFQYI